MDDLAKATHSAVKDRFSKDPFLLALLVSFLLVNWNVVLAFFDVGRDFNLRVSFINETLFKWQYDCLLRWISVLIAFLSWCIYANAKIVKQESKDEKITLKAWFARHFYRAESLVDKEKRIALEDKYKAEVQSLECYKRIFNNLTGVGKGKDVFLNKVSGEEFVTKIENEGEDGRLLAKILWSGYSLADENIRLNHELGKRDQELQGSKKLVSDSLSVSEKLTFRLERDDSTIANICSALRSIKDELSDTRRLTNPMVAKQKIDEVLNEVMALKK